MDGHLGRGRADGQDAYAQERHPGGPCEGDVSVGVRHAGCPLRLTS